MNINNNIAAAEHVMGLRVVEKTKRNYIGKLNTVKIFLTESYPNYLNYENNILLPIEDQVIKELCGWLSVNTDLPKKNRRNLNNNDINNEFVEIDENDDGHPDVNNIDENIFGRRDVTISYSTMQGYKSALLWLYSENNILIDASINKWIDEFITGYKKNIAEKKANGIMSIQEGKSPLSFRGYVSICKVLCEMTQDGRRNQFNESVFGWVFMTLSWNIIGRSHSVGSVMLQHLKWYEDSLIINLPKHKGDQTGEGLGNDKHVYANPLNPYICPILSLAVLIFIKHRGSEVLLQPLFDGKNSEERFHKILAKVIKNIPDNIDLGAAKCDIGSHSNRKGSATYVLGLHGLSAVQVYLRAGWSLGNVQDRYIIAGTGGDQIVGRAVSGLPVTDISFATLPPHFNMMDIEILNEIGWNNILPGFNHYPQCFQRVIPYLLASLIYHQDWLRENISPIHPLWNQPIFTNSFAINNENINIIQYFNGKVLTGVGYCSKGLLQATGIPEHLVISNQVNTVCRRIANLESTVLPGIRDDIISVVSAVPNAVKTILLDNFRIDGVMPVNMKDIEEIMSKNNEIILQRLNSIHSSSTNSTNINVMASENNNTNITYNTFYWGNKYRMVPQGFNFPIYNVKTIWNLWFFGNALEGIRPYRFLLNFLDDLNPPTQKVNVSRANKVLSYMIDIALENNYIDSLENIQKLSIEESNNLFDKVYPLLLQYCYEFRNPKRPNDLQMNTLADRLYKRQKVDRIIN